MNHILLIICYLSYLASSELVAVQVVSRHGTRAPDKLLNALCFNERENLQRYLNMSISLSGMTGRGMQELYDLGVFTAQRYKGSGFLKKKYIASDIYIRAVGSERTLQSAAIFANALYPADTRSQNYLADVPAAVPYYSIPDDRDDLIEVRKGGCAMRLARDVAHWDTTKGPKLWASDGIVEGLNEMCGNDIRVAVGNSSSYTVGDAIKDITDGITFDDIEGFPSLPGLTEERFVKYVKFAAEQLVDRLYGTPEQVTYMNGELPATLLNNFQKTMKGVAKVKFWAYHGHREMSYALLKLLGIDYSFLTRRGIPTAAIPAGTTVFFELHKNENEAEWVVQTWLWAPCVKDPTTGKEFHSLSIEKAAACPATLIKLKDCIENCPYDQFAAILNNHIQKTGTWRELCQGETTRPQFSTVPVQSYGEMKGFLLLATLIGFAFVLYLLQALKRFKYARIPETESLL